MQTPDGYFVKLRASANKQQIIADVYRDGRILNRKDKVVDIDDLRIYGLKCYGTFAGENGDVVVLLYDQDFTPNNKYLEQAGTK